MPIYEYECEQCGRRFEVWQKITDPPLSTCEHCHGKLHKLISQSSFILKGSGWYVTDYARKGQQGGAKKTDNKGSASQKTSSNNKG